MNCKAKGNRNEYKTIRLMEAAGYSCTRAAASLGVFDVIAIGSVDIVLIQVKSNQFPGSEEMEAIKSFVCPMNTRKLVHRWRDRAATPDVREV